jgi:exopolyphosphatase/guanosine-5'-triphosphate,3'-diphosphate pyrophosphatase
VILATIDVGTNTALLLVVRVNSNGTLEILHDEQRFVRLGERIDASGLILDSALERLRTTLLAYKATAETFGAKRVIVAGTSASRDARNSDDLVRFVRDETGLTYEILSGEEEARWAFIGAVSAFADVDGPVMAVDIGGGSTEITVGRFEASKPEATSLRFMQSIDVGAIRLTERFFSSLPPTAEEVERAKQEICKSLTKAHVTADAGFPLIAAAGTATALGLLLAGITAWDEERVGSMAVTYEEVASWSRRLLSLRADQVLALNPPVLTGRADVFPAGVLILKVLMEQVKADSFRISPRGLRHGLALRFAASLCQ